MCASSVCLGATARACLCVGSAGLRLSVYTHVSVCVSVRVSVSAVSVCLRLGVYMYLCVRVWSRLAGSCSPSLRGPRNTARGNGMGPTPPRAQPPSPGGQPSGPHSPLHLHRLALPLAPPFHPTSYLLSSLHRPVAHFTHTARGRPSPDPRTPCPVCRAPLPLLCLAHSRPRNPLSLEASCLCPTDPRLPLLVLFGGGAGGGSASLRDLRELSEVCPLVPTPLPSPQQMAVTKGSLARPPFGKVREVGRLRWHEAPLGKRPYF